MKYARFSLVVFSNMLVDVDALDPLPLLGPTGGPELLVLCNAWPVLPSLLAPSR